MAVTDLTNTKWLLNDEINVYNDFNYSINFTSNNNSYTSISCHEEYYSEMPTLFYNDIIVFSSNNLWYGNAYKTIEITGGTDVTNASLISWLTANATQVEEPTQSNYLEIYSNDERATHYKIYVNGVLVVTLPRVNVTQEGSEITVLSAPATQSGIEVTLE